MTVPFARRDPCPNLNHRRRDAPVGHCPLCGAMVNDRFHVNACSESQHAAARRQQSVFCVHCGTRLIAGPVKTGSTREAPVI